MINILELISNTITNYPNSLAFAVNDSNFSYLDFEKRIVAIKNILLDIELKGEKLIGVDASEISSFETYCQIYACIFAGKCFVPINLTYPKERIKYLIDKTGISSVLINSKSPGEAIQALRDSQTNFINTEILTAGENDKLIYNKIPPTEYAYILFTSGSTGFPKGVPITRSNLFGFVENFLKLGYEFDSNDRFIQMFDFTFDLSIFSYFVPALFGASIHPIKSRGIKLANTLSILIDNKISVALLVPSVLSFLKPYFDEIELPNLRYLFFCGEAMSNQLTAQFSKCVPNSKIVNFYGPTEATIFCIYYEWNQEKINYKHHNGAVSIGKSFPNMIEMILKENNETAKLNEVGELHLSGNQLTPGYLKDDEKNKLAFISLRQNNDTLRFYKTGDLAFYDKDGDIMYCGRKDFQVKIQGFRVELGEIEHQIGKIINGDDVIVVAIVNQNGNSELHAFLKGKENEIPLIKNKLPQILPKYMIPTDFHSIQNFPLNNNGKIDRNKLKELALELK